MLPNETYNFSDWLKWIWFQLNRTSHTGYQICYVSKFGDIQFGSSEEFTHYIKYHTTKVKSTSMLELLFLACKANNP